MSNRVWCWLLGRGIVHEPDDFRSTNPPSNPELLDYLAGEFIESGFDMKHLFRLVLNSRAYQLSSRTNEFNQHDAVHFSHYPVRRLSAEQLLSSISQATGAAEKFSGLPSGTRAWQLPDNAVRSEFLDLFGRPRRTTAIEGERSNELHIGQSLHLISSEHIENKIAASTGRVARLSAGDKSDEEILTELYLAALSRPPTDAEMKTLLGDKPLGGKERRARFEDVLWALLNTKEFLFNH
ncbi:MAG: DUF1553 domain-containing protein, partial [Planctomycetales bacterium]